jgi:serine/threonine protein kinase
MLSFSLLFLIKHQHRYVVIKKLGWGHFSTVWMVKDRRVVTNTQSPSAATNNTNPTVVSNQPLFFALKVQKSAEHYTEAAMDEVELLDCIAQERKRCEATLVSKGPMNRDSDGIRAIDNVDHSRHVATLYDSFFHNGPHGRHMSMVFSMLGCNLLSVIKAHNYRGIPIPAVKRMIKGVCKGLDFLHRRCQIIHTDLKPENILLQFPDQICPPTDLDMPGEDHADFMDYDLDDENNSQQEGMTIEELEEAIKNPKTSAEEKKKLKKRLKKKKQKERKKAASGATLDQILANEEAMDDSEIRRTLTDMAVNLEDTKSSEKGAAAKGDENKFISRNFVPLDSTQEQIAGIMNDTVVLTAAGRAEVESHLGACGSLMKRQHKVDGIAEVTFLMRVHGTEGEVADRVTAALDGIGSVAGDEGSARVWSCMLSTQKPGSAGSKEKAVKAMFSISQKSRKDLNDGVMNAWNNVVRLLDGNIGENKTIVTPSTISGARAKALGSLVAGGKPIPFSVFSVRFSVLSTMVVLGFLESRLPGVMFFTYRRDEGSPAMDSMVFGPHNQAICRHPLALRLKENGAKLTVAGENTAPLASSIFGYDLRLIKNFNAKAGPDQEGSLIFDLSAPQLERVQSYWNARRPIFERVKSFLGLDLKADGKDPQILSQKPGFKEGGKKPPPDSQKKQTVTKPASLAATKAAIARASYQPDLKDMDILMRSRAVIVDLGNACWTHRHFSEDIQTRQYRAPEVLIGSK